MADDDFCRSPELVFFDPLMGSFEGSVFRFSDQLEAFEEVGMFSGTVLVPEPCSIMLSLFWISLVTAMGRRTPTRL